MTFVGGYTVFLPGRWDVPSFLFSYCMVGVCPILFVGWKLLKGTTWAKPEAVDLMTGKPEVDAYEKNYIEPIPR